MAKTEGQGENIGYTWVHIGAIPSVGTQGSSDPGLAQHQRQKVSVGDDLEEMSREECCLGNPQHPPSLWIDSGFPKGFLGTVVTVAIVWGMATQPPIRG